MARKYVVIDTNVLVSGLITRNESSPTVQILRFLASRTLFYQQVIKGTLISLLADFIFLNRLSVP